MKKHKNKRSWLKKDIRLIEKDIIKNFTKNQIRMWDTLIFLTTFTLLAIPLHLIVWTGYDFNLICTITSDATEKVLIALGTDFFRIENMFIISTESGTLAADVVKDCSGWKSFLAIFSLIIATRRSSIKAKLIGIGLSIPIIFIVNVARLATTFHLTYTYGLSIFDFTHNLLWQGGLIIMVLAIWITWLNKIAFSKTYI